MKLFALTLIFLTIKSIEPSDVTLDRAIPSAGISVEFAGQIMKSTEIVSIPAVLSMNWIHTLFQNGNNADKTSCGARLKAIQELIIVQLKETMHSHLGALMSKGETASFNKVICQQEPDVCEHLGVMEYKGYIRPRPKRFIFTAGAAVGAGIGALGYWLYDKIAGNSAAEAILELRNNQKNIADLLIQNQNAILRVSNTLSQVWSITIQNKKDIEKLQSSYVCAEDTANLIIRSAPLISMIPNQFHRAINDLLRGKVTPDLVSYGQLQHLLQATESLSDTLYSYDGALFYQLSHTIPAEVSYDKEFVSFLIQVPRVTPDSTGILLEIHNFGIHNDSIVKRLQLPNYIARFRADKSSFIYVPVVAERCEKSPGVWLCGQHAFDYTYDPTCISNIMKGSIDGCTWEIKQNYIDPDVLITRSSVFHHSSSHTTTLFNITRGGKTAQVIHANKTDTRWTPLANFDTMIVGHHHIDGYRVKQTTPLIMELSYQLSNLELPTHLISGDLWKDVTGVNNSVQDMMTLIKHTVSDHLFAFSPGQFMHIGLNLGLWTLLTAVVFSVILISMKCRKAKKEKQKKRVDAAVRMEMLAKKYNIEE